MPFPEQQPREFTAANIEAIGASLTGVYGLFKDNQWVYVGRGNPRARLMAHHNGDNPCITRNAPTHYVDEVTTDDVRRERDLLLELGPTSCNERLG